MAETADRVRQTAAVIDELERPIRRATAWQLGSAGFSLGALAVLFLRVGDPLGPLFVQGVGTLALLATSVVLLVTAFRAKGRVRDHVLAGTRAILAGSDGAARPARVVSRGIAGAHPGYLAGAKDAQDTKALYLLLDVVTDEGRDLAGALVPRQAGMSLRRGNTVGVQHRPGHPGVAVLDLRVSPQELESLGVDPGWQGADPRSRQLRQLPLAALLGLAVGSGLALVLALTVHA